MARRGTNVAAPPYASADDATGRSRTPMPRGEATRQRLEETALDLFYRQGFKTTTMREITGTSGLTPAAFYNHFQSKDDLLFSIIMDAFRSLEAEVDAALAAAGKSAPARIAAFVRALTLWHCAHIRQARVANRESLELTPDLLESVRQRRSALRRIAEKTVAAGMTSGEFDPPRGPVTATSRVMASSILGFVQSISDLEIGALSAQQLADLFVDMVLRMVGAPNTEV